MYWNDPSMYGVTLPYKDIPMQAQTPILPWQNVPHYLPQNLGWVPQNVGFLPQNLGFVPQNLGFVPQNIGFMPQTFGFTPNPIDFRMPFDPFSQTKAIFRDPLHQNLPFYGLHRPF